MDRPKDLPNRLECAYCKRNYRHGGECKCKDSNRSETGCLFFKMDEKGCIRNTDLKIPFSLYSDIPPLNMWDDRWTLYGVETQIRILKIYSLSWDKTKGILYVYSNCDYFVNEFNKDYIDNKNKPNLKIIK